MSAHHRLSDAKISLLYKAKRAMSLPTFKNVPLFHCPLSLWLMLYLSSTPSLVLARALGIIICCLVLHFMVFRVYLTFTKAAIIIFKHATFLCASNLSMGLALGQAETDYQAANIDSKIQQYLTAPSQKHSIEGYLDFIMATAIGLFTLVSVKIIFHQVFNATCSAISIFIQST